MIQDGDVIAWFDEFELHVAVRGVQVFGEGLGEPPTESWFTLLTKDEVRARIGCSPLGGPCNLEEMETLGIIENRMK